MISFSKKCPVVEWVYLILPTDGLFDHFLCQCISKRLICEVSGQQYFSISGTKLVQIKLTYFQSGDVMLAELSHRWRCRGHFKVTALDNTTTGHKYGASFYPPSCPGPLLVLHSSLIALASFCFPPPPRRYVNGHL